ncbi:MAG TPA: transcriptional regulator GcvA [Bosea sp. (in: a-proteobacteria)]|jgi:LysR family glycine cleavage system transcriptional activator|uniref:transcriptional regulator GcvA n=1 Tax=Bosea sp. (in: a-proteobacteria) TaxID=1871050 RepID=UPI002E129E52|nr:transcriptional regulator GcvA [Bosea sp. (in: a-proteobacteria)]
MSRRQLPPLTSLRAFEAAARHLNFERAGEELAVTASAIGQQVRALEAWLRRPLFIRLPSKGVALTGLGERYAAAISGLLDQLNEATAQAMRPDASTVLTVSTMPSFALSWLIPRLGSLKERHPELEVRISISVNLTDFGREDVDVAIRFGQGVYPGLRSDLLMEEHFFPVCSAALLNDPLRPLREPSDLRHHTLLHEAAEGIPDYITWPRWLALAGVDDVDASQGPRFSHTFLALQAAASGQGVALATSVLIGDYQDAGRLVRPFPHQVRSPHQYYLVCPEASADRPAIAAFRNWIRDEARAHNEQL